MHDLKGTISKGNAAGALTPAEADELTAQGVDMAEPGVYRCKGCGVASNVVTTSATDPGKWKVKGCTCKPGQPTGDPARSFGVPDAMTGGGSTE